MSTTEAKTKPAEPEIIGIKQADKDAILARLDDPGLVLCAGAFAEHNNGRDAYCAAGLVLDACGTGVWEYQAFDNKPAEESKRGGWRYVSAKYNNALNPASREVADILGVPRYRNSLENELNISNLISANDRSRTSAERKKRLRAFIEALPIRKRTRSSK